MKEINKKRIILLLFFFIFISFKKFAAFKILSPFEKSSLQFIVIASYIYNNTMTLDVRVSVFLILIMKTN